MQNTGYYNISEYFSKETKYLHFKMMLLFLAKHNMSFLEGKSVNFDSQSRPVVILLIFYFNLTCIHTYTVSSQYPIA